MGCGVVDILTAESKAHALHLTFSSNPLHMPDLRAVCICVVFGHQHGNLLQQLIGSSLETQTFVFYLLQHTSLVDVPLEVISDYMI